MASQAKITKLHKALDRATTYRSWLEIARTLDREYGFEAWREAPPQRVLPADDLRADMALFHSLAEQGRGLELLQALSDSVFRQSQHLQNDDLYHHSMSGEAPYIVQTYLDTVCGFVRTLALSELSGKSPAERLGYIETLARSNGRSALMLSGGASPGISHLGVVKALFQEGVLPNIICGSSMGAIVASGVCTRSDDELSELFHTPEEAHRTAARLNGLRAMFKRGSLYSSRQLREHIDHNCFDPYLTFEEAFQRSGRELIVSVSPTEGRRKPRVLNHVNAPDVIVASATQASCSIPGLFEPVILSRKDKAGSLSDYMPKQTWVDGSMRADLPMARVGRLFNVNHFIVSQANPYVVPFLSRGRESMRRTLFNVGGSVIRANTSAVINELRKRIEVDPIRPALDQMHALVGQDYLGHINIHPRFQPTVHMRVLKNPDLNEFKQHILRGERSAWPMLAMVRDQTRISSLLHELALALRTQTSEAAEMPETPPSAGLV